MAFLDRLAISKALVKPVCPTSWQSPLNTLIKTSLALRILTFAGKELNR